MNDPQGTEAAMLTPNRPGSAAQAVVLRISVIRYRGASPMQPIAFDFDRRGGSLGREAGNDLCLPDSERHVSRVQARIDFEGQRFRLVDLGRNPTLVDGRPLDRAERLALSGGEVITIGPYELLVAPSFLADVSVPAASEDPFAVFAAQPASRPEPVVPDPFAKPSPAPAVCDELGLGQSGGAASIDELLGLRAAQGDLLGMPLAAAQFPGQPLQTHDPLALFGGAQSGAQVRAAPQSDDALLAQAFSPPPLKPPSRATAASEAPVTRVDDPPAQSVRPPSALDGELLDAFLRGLGVPIELPAGLTPALMEQAGLLLREATQGTLDLLKARAGIKREVRAEATMIASRDNNPLKFSPDVAFALTQLLTSRSHGFMAGREAMRDAYDDLRAHQLGLMAGMRSALAAVLVRFEPAGIEARLAHRLLDRLQPSGRKARLWDLFGQHYAELAREATDDFNALFDKPFLEAYEQAGRLRSGDARDSPARGV